MQSNSFITLDEAEALVARIIETSMFEHDDDAAAALTTIIERLSAMPEAFDRDNSRMALSRAIYPRTFIFDKQREAFTVACAASSPPTTNPIPTSA